MANPIAVKGIRRLLDGLGDQVSEAAKKAANNPDEPNWKVSGVMAVEGQYGIDKNGELGIVGNVVASGSELVEPIDAEAGMETTLGTDWNSRGAGTIHIEFKVEVASRPVE